MPAAVWLLFFTKPVAVLLANQQYGFADFMQMDTHGFFYRLGIAFFQRGENLMMLAQKHLRRGDMVQTHIADAIDGGFNIFHRLPGQLTVGDNRQLLVKFIIEQEKVV